MNHLFCFKEWYIYDGNGLDGYARSPDDTNDDDAEGSLHATASYNLYITLIKSPDVQTKWVDSTQFVLGPSPTPPKKVTWAV